MSTSRLLKSTLRLPKDSFKTCKCLQEEIMIIHGFLQVYFKSTSSLLQVFFNSELRLLQGHLKTVSKILQDYLIAP